MAGHEFKLSLSMENLGLFPQLIESGLGFHPISLGGRG